MPTLRQDATYISFPEILSSVLENSALPALGPFEQRILRTVARAGYDKSRLSVRDLMAMRELGAAATIHSRLKSMQKKGWISLADTEDARRKQVVLTEPALRILDEVGTRIEQTSKNKCL
ncbi:helix-turn-helix domain-containing protein [Noviherbaspirillum pedocola]|uniref:Winged helix-turn-helix domain-containing protein n=1 Tax=Noviherbaspirillum pedocola TaxID=2801341 RepID=A0A934T2P3_9BURK|nr:winged helix-turn-helix domain-containing protein [Noviherbaspirillum pedocola]MBK4738512.1 winged helix-turn-helix domain-containing protein [Noviherbaspirillum pedocola]